MKKIFFTILTGTSLVLVITNSTYAQNLNSIAKLDQPLFTKSIIFTAAGINPAGDAGSFRLNEHNSRAVRNFIREYENVPDVKWSKAANGLNVAYFSREGLQTWVYYTKNGNHLGRLSYYLEEKLSPDIRHRVRNTYYDFTIFHVTEIFWNDKLAYVISTKNEHSKDEIFYKIIKVVDGGEMEVMQEFSEKLNDKD